MVWAPPAAPSANCAQSIASSAKLSSAALPVNLSNSRTGRKLFQRLPVEVSPCGYHLAISVKDKIWRGEYVDILSLLPSTKEFKAKPEKSDKEEDRRRPLAKSFNHWL